MHADQARAPRTLNCLCASAHTGHAYTFLKSVSVGTVAQAQYKSNRTVTYYLEQQWRYLSLYRGIFSCFALAHCA